MNTINESNIKEYDEVLAKIGINTRYIYGKKKGKYRSLNDIVRALAKAFKKLEDNTKTEEEIKSNEIIKQYTIRKLFGIKDMGKINHILKSQRR